MNNSYRVIKDYHSDNRQEIGRYCSYRDAAGATDGLSGDITILMSSDGVNWKTVCWYPDRTEAMAT